jgi:nucleolin
VNFQDPQSVVDATSQSELAELKGRVLRIEARLAPRTSSREAPEVQRDYQPSKKLFLYNIPYSGVDEGDLEVFKDFGEVAELRLVRDDTGRLKGFGFLEFQDISGAEAAMEAAKRGEAPFVAGREIRYRYFSEEPRGGSRSSSRSPRKYAAGHDKYGSPRKSYGGDNDGFGPDY